MDDPFSLLRILPNNRELSATRRIPEYYSIILLIKISFIVIVIHKEG
jgi:hypothetical protein